MNAEKIRPDELRDELLDAVRGVVKYWANAPEIDNATGNAMSIEDRCEGVAFSILSQLDGCGGLPAFDLVSCVHPEDEDQSRNGVVISTMLHEHFYNEARK